MTVEETAAVLKLSTDHGFARLEFCQVVVVARYQQNAFVMSSQRRHQIETLLAAARERPAGERAVDS
jgi:hypothetical protein